jgi:hypothetical protein
MLTRRTRGRSRGGATHVPVPGPDVPPGGGGGGGGETANNLDFNFATNVYTVGATSTALASQFSTTRASSMQAERVDGGFTTIASGVVARTDLGMTRSDSSGGGADDNLVPSNNMTGAVAGSPGTGPTSWQMQAQGTGGFTRTLATGALGDGTGRNYLDITLSGTGDGNALVIYLETGGVTVTASTAYKQSVECAVTAGSFTNFSQARLACDFFPTYTWGGETDLRVATSTLTKYERTGIMSASDSTDGGIHMTFTATGAVNVTLRIVQPYFGINGSVTTAGAAETLTATGDLLTLLRATEGSLFVEFHQATANPLDGSGITGKIITAGAAGAITMLGLYGGSSVMCTPITAAASGGGGCMGMARAMLMWNASGTRLIFNGGEVSTGAAFASRAGNPATFLSGLNAYIRRIIGWTTVQTDTFAKNRTALTFDDFGSTSPGSLTLYGRTQTFQEEWNQFTYGSNVRYLPDTNPSNAKYQIPGKFKSTMHYYDNAQQGRHGMYYGGNSSFLFRWDDPDFLALGYRNLDVVANDAGNTSALRWRLEHRSLWPAGVVSLIDGGTIPQISGATINYLCPMLSTHQEPDNLNNGIGFSQDAGVWEFRIKFPPKAAGVWPGVWTMCDNGWPPEWDFIERFGYAYGNGFTHTVHWPRGGNLTEHQFHNPAVDMANDYHVLTYIQTAHVFDCYVDGKYLHTVDITGRSPAPDFVGRRQYWIVSGGTTDATVGWIEPPDGTTPTQNDMYFDWFKNYS